jgi:hypothetical protein
MRQKPVLLDMSNYTDVEVFAVKESVTPVTFEAKEKLALKLICVLRRILQLVADQIRRTKMTASFLRVQVARAGSDARLKAEGPNN